MIQITRNTILSVGILLILAPLFIGETAIAQNGIIEGVVKITAKKSQTVYGDWLRVLLVREKVSVSDTKKILTSNPYKRIDEIVDAHMAFYKKVQGKIGEPDYLVASTLTRSDGTFKFSGISTGAYFLVVTFPSTIQGYKVAWQLPVSVDEKDATRIELTEHNYLLPTYTRD